jgi:RNA polymerase sigma-70 factor, ECF subfamily
LNTFSPEELVMWCRRTLPDDTRAFEALVAQYKRSVFATAYRLMDSREEAEDQAQETFLKIYRGVTQLEEPRTLPAWIQRITVNTCLDALARQRRRPATTSITAEEGSQHEDRDYADTRTPGPNAAAEQDELRRCLESALDGLDPEARRVILLRDVEDMPYEEIAGALKIGLSALKMRLHRARLAVRRLLEEVCPGVAGAART